jgi:fructoselysine-6-P-deglycase FrlB-like protein
MHAKASSSVCLVCLLVFAPLQKQDVAMLELAKQLKDSSSLMFFARGNNYATALEAALKVGLGVGLAAMRLPKKGFSLCRHT